MSILVVGGDSVDAITQRACAGGHGCVEHWGFRPTNENVLKTSAAAFTHPPHVFTIGGLGGWDQIFIALFSPRGAWTKAVEEVRQ